MTGTEEEPIEQSTTRWKPTKNATDSVLTGETDGEVMAGRLEDTRKGFIARNVILVTITTMDLVLERTASNSDGEVYRCIFRYLASIGRKVNITYTLTFMSLMVVRWYVALISETEESELPILFLIDLELVHAFDLSLDLRRPKRSVPQRCCYCS